MYLYRLLLAIFVFGIIGVAAELLLLEHFEDALQLIPFGVMALGIGAALAWARRPSRASLRTFQGVVALFAASGAAGVLLHYRGNVEFELEMYPAMQGWELFWKAMEGATPTLAPGLMVQLGLLGLVSTHAHPALRRGGGGRDTREEDT